MAWTWLSKIVGGSVVDAATGIAGAIDKFVETPDEKRAAETLLAKMQQEPDKWQAQINMVEASHRTMFVAGWRPAIGWVCATSLACFFIPQYVLGAIMWVKMCLAANTLLPYPISADAVLELVLAMLGMGSLRMIDKMVGKSK